MEIFIIGKRKYFALCLPFLASSPADLVFGFFHYLLDDLSDFYFFPLSGKQWTAFYHLQSGKLIHYEFVLNSGLIYFCLHFELPELKENIRLRNHVFEIAFPSGKFDNNILKTPVYHGTASIEFSFPFINDFKHLTLYAQIMKDFVNLSFPTLFNLIKA